MLVGALGLRVEALLRVADAQVEPGLEVLGLEAGDVLELGDGRAVVALVHLQPGQLVPREGIGRVELDGGLQFLHRLFGLARVGVGEPEVQVRVGVVGLELDGGLVLADGEVERVRREEAGEVVVRGGAVGLEAQRDEVGVERLAELLSSRRRRSRGCRARGTSWGRARWPS